MRVIGDDEGYVDITTPANIDPSTLRHKYAFVSFNKPIDCISSMARTNVIYVADTPYAKFGLYAEGFIRFDTADDGSHIFPAAAIKMVKLRKLTESEFETRRQQNTKLHRSSPYGTTETDCVSDRACIYQARMLTAHSTSSMRLWITRLMNCQSRTLLVTP